MMKLLSDDGTTRVFADNDHLLVVDLAGLYLYHLACGGLKMGHVVAERDYSTLKEYHEIVRAITFPCECVPHVPYRPTVQQTLANLFISLGTCQTIEEAREMVMIAASREEMRNGTERQAL